MAITDAERTEIFERLAELESRTFGLAKNKDATKAYPEGNGSNGNGSKYIFAILGLIVTLLLTIISGLGLRLADHDVREGHPPMMKNMAGVQTEVKGIRHDVDSLETRVENFKVERQRINDNESLVRTLNERFMDIDYRVKSVEDHTKELGHPHVQTEMYKDIKKELHDLEAQVHALNGRGLSE